MIDDEILTAAFRVWGESFYQITSLTSVAEELGVTKPALYRHFKSKEALFDAMYDSCYDRLAHALKSGYETSLAAKDDTEGALIMVRVLAAFFLQNRDDFIFWISQIYGNKTKYDDCVENLRTYGVDFGFFLPKNKDDCAVNNFRLSAATMFFMIIFFYRNNFHDRLPQSSAALSVFLDSIDTHIRRGLDFPRGKLAALNFEQLEKNAAACPIQMKGSETVEKIFHVIAETIAESDALFSMGIVARKLGCSKSSLYSHFKNKAHMLNEYMRYEMLCVANHAARCSRLSTVPEEQLFLALAGIFKYLHQNYNILQTIDKLRVYKSCLHKTKIKNDWMPYDKSSTLIYCIFSEIKNPDGSPFLNERDTEWILFLIVNTLLHCSGGADYSNIMSKDLRNLFMFIAGGIEK